MVEFIRIRKNSGLYPEKAKFLLYARLALLLQQKTKRFWNRNADNKLGICLPVVAGSGPSKLFKKDAFKGPESFNLVQVFSWMRLNSAANPRFARLSPALSLQASNPGCYINNNRQLEKI